MLRSSKLRSAELTRDGQSVGEVLDVLFDDRNSQVRYLAVDIGTWREGHKILVPPAALAPAGRDDGMLVDTPRLETTLDQAQLEQCPSTAVDRPVSRQHEIELYERMGWQPYWLGIPMAAPGPVWTPAAPAPAVPATVRDDLHHEADPHLRSTNEIEGYYIHATDGDIGHVEDLLIDPARWIVSHFVIDTKNWWPGTKVVVPTSKIAAIDWAERTLAVEVDRAWIKSQPVFDETWRGA